MNPGQWNSNDVLAPPVGWLGGTRLSQGAYGKGRSPHPKPSNTAAAFSSWRRASCSPESPCSIWTRHLLSLWNPGTFLLLTPQLQPCARTPCLLYPGYTDLFCRITCSSNFRGRFLGITLKEILRVWQCLCLSSYLMVGFGWEVFFL